MQFFAYFLYIPSLFLWFFNYLTEFIFWDKMVALKSYAIVCIEQTHKGGNHGNIKRCRKTCMCRCQDVYKRQAHSSILQSEPRSARTPVWALPRSLAATYGIDVSFFSSGYLDVSVPRVPFHTLWIGVWMHEVFSCGFPHSEISGSRDICSSPKLFAAYHVFHRLLVPRHPPCALIAWPFASSP